MSQDHEHDEPIMGSFSVVVSEDISVRDLDLGIQATPWDAWEHGLPRIHIEDGDDNTITLSASWPDDADPDEVARWLLDMGDMGFVVEGGGK